MSVTTYQVLLIIAGILALAGIIKPSYRLVEIAVLFICVALLFAKGK